MQFLFSLTLILLHLSISCGSSCRSRDSPLRLSECRSRVLWEAEKSIIAYRQCLVRELRENNTEIWHRLEPAIKTCLTRDKFWKALDVRRIGKSRPLIPSKPVVLPASNRSSCVVVFAPARSPIFEKGSSEKKLHSLVPRCRFQLVGHITGYDHWTVHEKRVASLDVGQKVDISEKKIYYARYDMVKVKTLLEKDVKEPRVDYLWIDQVAIGGIERNGLTYALPKFAFPEYSLFTDPINVTVCQVVLATELFISKSGNFDLLADARPLFKDLLMSAVSNSSFLPFRSVFSNDDQRLRTFYMNVSDTYCMTKYLANKVCDSDKCYGHI